APGQTQVYIAGDGNYDTEFVVPSVPSVVQIRRFRVGRLVTGIVGVAVGGVMAFTGLIYALVGTASSDCGYPYYSTYSCSSSSSSLTAVGTTLAVAGVAVGATLGIIGFTGMGRNRLEVSSAGMASERTRLRFAGAAAAPVAGGGAAATAVFTF